MDIRRTRIGVTVGHAGQPPAPVDEYTLDNRRGLAIKVWTYGATLIEVRVPDGKGNVKNVVLRFPDLPAYENRAINQYLGATLGRYARCVKQGRFSIGGTTYQLMRNIGGHHFHGGEIGFDRYVWEADAERKQDEIVLRLCLESADGDQGYPGKVSAETLYRLNRDRQLTFEHRATTTASTIVGLTNHAFWNLAGFDVVNNHRLAINAGRVVSVNDEHLPDGSPVSVSGTPLDFRTARQIADERLDHCFVLGDPSWAVELADPHSGRSMRVTTDQPGLAVYSADGFRSPRAGLCIQTTALPDAPNRRDFPTVRLDPGEIYRHRTSIEFASD